MSKDEINKFEKEELKKGKTVKKAVFLLINCTPNPLKN